MDKQPSQENILKKALTLLVHQAGLLPEEVSTLRLTDLHLAGKEPNINFTPAEGEPPKKVDLDLDAHRALVGWLVARPDSVDDFLFVDENTEGLSPEMVKSLVGTAEPPAEDQPPEDKHVTEPAGVAEEPPDDEIVHDKTMVSPLKAPVPPEKEMEATKPRSAPELGAPPPGFGSGQFPPKYSAPPSSIPEDDDSAAGQTDTQSTSQPKTTSSGFRPEARPFPPRPIGEKKPRVPPRPVRRRDSKPVPVLVKQEPPSPPPPQPVPIVEPKVAPAEAAVGKTEKPATPDIPERTPVVKADVAANGEPAKPKAAPIGKKLGKAKAPPVKPDKPKRRPAALPIAAGGAVLLLLLACVACAGVGGWVAFGSQAGGDLLAGLGLVQPEVTLPDNDIQNLPTFTPSPTTEAIDSTFESPLSPLNSPLSTPTLPPTSTTTPLPPTNTPVAPTDTPTLIPKATEAPTNTPAPTDTPTPEPPLPTNTPVPVDETPTPEGEPTSALKYGAPVLTGPDNGIEYTGINEIALTWEPVNELAADEQYAIRIVYPFNNEITYGGAQVKEPVWIVPLQLYGRIDPPENKYEWFVVVERLNDDGSGTAISPESERRSFIWK